MFKIEKGVEIPQVQHRKGRAETYAEAFRKMEIGDSFFVKENGTKNPAAQLLSAHAHQYKKKNPGVEFTTRTVSGGGRIWRIA